MAEIEVTSRGENTYSVTVTDGRATEHAVTLDPAYHEKLTGGRVTPEVLIEKSFVFLLERESNTMILSHFDLPLIGHYFPEYEKSISDYL